MARRRKKGIYANIGSALGGAGSAASSTASKGGGRNRKRSNVYASVGSAVGAAGGSAKAQGRGLKKYGRQQENAAIRAVTNYAAGSKAYKPTLAQFRTAWPKLTPDVRDVLGPAILKRATTEDFTAERGVIGSKNNVRPLPGFLRKYNPEAFDAYLKAVPGAAAVKQRQAQTDKAFNDDLGRAVDAGLLVAPVGPLLRVGKAGVTALRGARAARAERVGQEGATVARTTEATSTGARTTAKAGEEAAGTASKGARGSRGARAGRGAREPKPPNRTTPTAKPGSLGKTVGARGGRIAVTKRAVAGSRPVRGAQAIGRTTAKAYATKPARIVRTGVRVSPANPRQALKYGAGYSAASGAVAGIQGENVIDAATSGVGTVGDIVHKGTGALRDNLGVVGAAAADILELPAALVPSTYLLGDAVLKGIGGDWSKLEEQWNAYKDSGLLPAVFSGDFEQAKKALLEHPVFSALEVSGAGAAGSRAAGAALRRVPAGAEGSVAARLRQAGSTERKPLKLRADQGEVPRTYSKGIVRKGAQVALDRRRARRHGGQKASAKETENIIAGKTIGSGWIDRDVGAGEVIRRAGRGEEEAAAQAAFVPPRPKGLGARKAAANRNGVPLVLMGIVKSARSWKADLANYAEQVRAAGDDLRAQLKAATDRDEIGRLKSKIDANEQLLALVEETAKHGDIATIYEAANQLGPRLREQQRRLAEEGLISAAQSERAALIPAGKVHLGLRSAKPEEALQAIREHRALRREHRQTKKQQNRTERRLARAEATSRESQGRLQRLEAEAGKKRRALEKKLSDLEERAREKGATPLLQRQIERTRAQLADIDRRPTSLLNRERAKLLDAEGAKLTEAQRLEQVKARRAELKQRVKDEEPPPATEQIVTKEGNAITTAEIKRLLEEKGVNTEEIAFITQRPGATGRGSFYRPWWSDPQRIAQQRRTGAATVEGFDASAEALIEQLVRTRGILDAKQMFDRTIRQYAARTRPFKNLTDANRARRDPAHYGLDPELEWRPVRVGGRLEAGNVDELAGATADEIGAQFENAAAWQDARISPTAQGPIPNGDVVMIPEAVARRLDEHFARPQLTRMAWQAFNQAFKGVVLPYSPKWLAGNLVDITLRSAVAQQFPFLRQMNQRFADEVARRAMEIDPFEGRVAMAKLTPGQQFASQELNNVRRGVGEQFAATPLAPVAHGLNILREQPGIRTLHNFHQRYRDWVFKQNDHWIETPPQQALLGKQLRQEAIKRGYIKRWEGTWKLEDAALDDLARGLLKTENQVKYAQGIERVLGQWTGNSPAMRAFLVDFAPFGMWTRAATKFVFKTMPVDHPVLTGIIAASEQMTLPERQALGLTVFVDDPVPSNLRGGLPLPGGGIRPGVTGLTSAGFFADPGAAFSQTILPQFSGPLASLAGLDWTGQQLKNADGTPASDIQKFLTAASTTAEAYVPIFPVAQRIGTAASADSPLDAAADLTLGKNLDASLTDYLRSLSQSKQINVPAEGSSSSGSSSSSSSPSTSLPPWYDTGSGSSSSSSSGGGSVSLPPWYGG